MQNLVSDIDEIVHISGWVLALWLFSIEHPVLVVDDVLVEVFAPDQVHVDEPLVGDVVELHVVTLLPIVK